MSPVELFFLKRARRVHHNKPKRRRKLPPKQRAVVFETLEPRILLDAAPLMVDMAALGNDLTVKQTGANIEVLDNTSTVVASHAAADTSKRQRRIRCNAAIVLLGFQIRCQMPADLPIGHKKPGGDPGEWH